MKKYNAYPYVFLVTSVTWVTKPLINYVSKRCEGNRAKIPSVTSRLPGNPGEKVTER
jgi:hypothetical protein